MDLNVSSTSFQARFKAVPDPAKIAPKSSKMAEVSEKMQELLKKASNQELLASATSASAGAEASLATKFPFVAAGIAALNSSAAGLLYTDARAVKKEIAGKDSLIQQADEKMVEQEIMLEEKDAKIEELEVENEILQEQNGALSELLTKTWWQKIFCTRLWSKL